MRILVLAALLSAAPVTAATVDFGNQSVGAISGSLTYPGVTFTSSTGKLYIGAAGADTSLCSFTGRSCVGALTATFAQPVGSLKFFAVGDDYATSSLFVSLATTGGDYSFSTGGFDGNVHTASLIDLSAYTGIQSIVLTTNDVKGLGYENFSFSTGAVPEPATWALMLTGFGLIGTAMRRRSPVVATA